jgi:hypothetical protein
LTLLTQLLFLSAFAALQVTVKSAVAVLESGTTFVSDFDIINWKTMARVGGDKYPPTEFSQKYAAVMAPNGKLVSPSDVFGEGKCFEKGVEERTRQAFMV